MPARPPFLLSKWYFDVVTDQGSFMVLYAARLRWGRLTASYGAVLCEPAGGERTDTSTVRRIARPRRSAGTISWACAPLDVSGTWSDTAAPFRRTLLRTPAGAVQWACLAPRSTAEARCGAVTLRGTGYVEYLRLTIPPWDLPFDTLRWGRFASERRSVVFIDWGGRQPRRWVWMDGREQPASEIGDGSVRAREAGVALFIEPGRVMRDRRIPGVIAAAVPAVSARLGRRLVRMREVKRLSRSTLAAPGCPDEPGWTVHEVVTW